MSWARLDDQYTDHPKVVAAGPLAAWLNTCAICYCARYLTDGFVPAAQVPKLAGVDEPLELVERLLSVGLWEVGVDGYIVHDYLDYNPSRAQVMAEREAARERMNKGRRSGEVRANSGRSSGEVREKFNSPVPVPVPVPVPTPKPKRSPKSEDFGAADKPPRAPDPIWDAVAAASGRPLTRDERSDFGSTISQLREVGATQEELAGFPAWWWQTFPGAKLTHRCYRDHWGKFLHSPPRPPQISDIKNGRIKAALTVDLSDITAKHEARNAQRRGVSGEVDRPVLPAPTGRLGPGGNGALPHVLRPAARGEAGGA